jgi:hypothetical protein
MPRNARCQQAFPCELEKLLSAGFITQDSNGLVTTRFQSDAVFSVQLIIMVFDILLFLCLLELLVNFTSIIWQCLTLNFILNRLVTTLASISFL